MGERTPVYVQTYRSMDTEELVKLQERGGLTEEAADALQSVLRERGVTAEQRERLTETIREESAPPRLASPGRRLAGKLIDGFVASILGVVAYQFAGLSSLRENDKELVAIAGFLFYFLFADGLPSGQSLGKRLLKLAAVVKATGQPCGIGRSLVRNASAVIFAPVFGGFIDWMSIFAQHRQRLGDYIAGTEVINIR